MRKYLKLSLDRVDFVDAGANPGAHITLAKRAPTETHMADPILPEGVAKRLADGEAERIELKKQLDVANAKAEANEKAAKDTAETVAKMLEDAAKAESVTIAKSFDKAGPVDDLGRILFLAKRHFPAEDYGKLTAVLKGAHEKIVKGNLFIVRGTDGDATDASDLDRLVAKTVIEKKMSKGDALRDVLKTTEGSAAWAAARGN